MSLVREWNADVRKKSVQELREIDKALTVLLGWKLFRDNYAAEIGRLQALISFTLMDKETRE